ncbi:MBL fold metallo-hydrolase [Jannaschia sp. CCS1]|uniref:MBL fold metallo-hydrolase n=1 Tax=Jannaschia sp. (strain CCS1) TaxID=290400 RepID=UPI000053BE77|nr:MBL fold metallo-hydrolase [Jannaschia sp. CCS1]ABD56430.1 beta-lactamase-like protein [Jannaschia sp. CCS1]
MSNELRDYVVLLGTKGGPSQRPGSSKPTSNLYVLNGQPIVVDCGMGVTHALIGQGMQLRDLSLIFITHLHADHYLELGPLIHTAWTSGLKEPVDIYGPAALSCYWANFVEAMRADIDLRIADDGRMDIRDLVRIHPVDPGNVMTRGGLTVEVMRSHHPPMTDCFAYSFRTARTHVVCSGDTAPLPALADFARGADLLIHEAMLVEALPDLMRKIGDTSGKLKARLLRVHSPAQDVAAIAAEAHVKALALTHLIPSNDPNFPEAAWRTAVEGIYEGPLFVGHDGLRIDL